MLLQLLPAFEWGSSDVDWCEGNYEVTPLVAEFWNTVSNVLFFVLPPLLMYLFRAYGQAVTWGVHVVWLLLLVVGAGSVYFHATLSLFGQLLDEMAIIWVVMTALAVWFPRRYLPKLWQDKRQYFASLILMLAVMSTCLACVMPALNCMFLFLLVVPVVVLLIFELKRCRCPRVYNLGLRSFLIFTLAIACWLTDRFLCDALSRLGVPYLHCAWHVGIALSSYQVCVLFAYFSAVAQAAELQPVIRLWPAESYGIWGVPYVAFRADMVEDAKDI